MSGNDVIENVKTFYVGFDAAMILFVMTLNVLYTLQVITSWRVVNRYVKQRPLRDYRYVGMSEMSMPVSILVPGYNEEPTIVESVRSLLVTSFRQLEVIIINDGSKDRTLDRLIDAFELVPVDRVPRSGLPTQPVKQVYLSSIDDRIVVIDKDNGGKADALNTGLNYAQFPLVCAIDADTVLDPGAISRLVWEFQSDPDIVATGGIVRVVNGSRVEGGKITSIRTPRSIIANIQIMEYLRAFLGGRLAWSRWGILLVVSGAFGLFRRDVMVAAGGYDVDSITEDAELIVRIRRMMTEQGRSCKITFFPDPICWTEAPGDFTQLVRQRDRWQRGLGELLIKHRSLLFNPKYGRVGMLAVPYFWIFEFLEPIVTVIGLTLCTFGFIIGMVNPFTYALLLAFSTAYGMLISMAVILMEERAFQRYPGWKDLGKLTLASFLENFGYRQWQAYVRLRAIFRIRKSSRVWGEMTRAGFAPSDAVA